MRYYLRLKFTMKIYNSIYDLKDLTAEEEDFALENGCIENMRFNRYRKSLQYRLHAFLRSFIPHVIFKYYDDWAWNKLINKGIPDTGVAALMGNFYAESYVVPYLTQGDSEPFQVSIDYTNNVNNGTISEYDFVHNGPRGGGYGLAQWTYWSRKENLYNYFYILTLIFRDLIVSTTFC